MKQNAFLAMLLLTAVTALPGRAATEEAMGARRL